MALILTTISDELSKVEKEQATKILDGLRKHEINNEAIGIFRGQQVEKLKEKIAGLESVLTQINKKMIEVDRKIWPVNIETKLKEISNALDNSELSEVAVAASLDTAIACQVDQIKAKIQAKKQADDEDLAEIEEIENKLLEVEKEANHKYLDQFTRLVVTKEKAEKYIKDGWVQIKSVERVLDEVDDQNGIDLMIEVVKNNLNNQNTKPNIDIKLAEKKLHKYLEWNDVNEPSLRNFEALENNMLISLKAKETDEQSFAHEYNSFQVGEWDFDFSAEDNISIGMMEEDDRNIRTVYKDGKVYAVVISKNNQVSEMEIKNAVSIIVKGEEYLVPAEAKIKIKSNSQRTRVAVAFGDDKVETIVYDNRTGEIDEERTNTTTIGNLEKVNELLGIQEANNEDTDRMIADLLLPQHLY